MTKTPRVLRPYQEEAKLAVMSEWAAETRRTAVVLPTGTGKSSVIASVAAEAADMGLSVVMLAHRAELLDQMAATVDDIAPGRFPVGIVRADQDEHHRQIVAASFQTLMNDRRHSSLGPRQVVLVDETHHVTADSYRSVVEGFGSDIFFCGFTATLRREDGKALRDMIDSIAYEKDLRWAIDQGFLVKPNGLTVKIPNLDLGKVKTTAGDFQNNALAEVMEAETPHVVKAILDHTADRRPIIFAASVAAAHDIAAKLADNGMQAEAVTGEMGYDLRCGIYERFRKGYTRALVTVQVLTEGADFPMCDTVVIARPTQSQNLYSQMVGRALRLYDGKTDALVLDLVGSSRVLKLVVLSSLDPHLITRTVDPDGNELPPEDDEPDLAGAERAPKTKRLGPIDTISIDLLGEAETDVLWLGTHKGVPFLSPADADDLVFLWEMRGMGDPPLYRIGTMNTRGRQKVGGWLAEGRSLPLSLAKTIAEDFVVDSGYALPVRVASWRKSQPASPAQIRYAESLGVAQAAEMTKARLSDEISIELASRRLDQRR